MRFYIKRIWLIFGGLCAFVCLIFLFISLGWFGFMPSFHDLENPESYLASEVISSDQQILGTYYVQNRTNAEYADLSPNLIKALIATEDIRFYQHSGIDIWSLGRVFGKTIIGRNKSAGGGSTITQQLAKNLFPRKNQWKITLAFRKLKEWVIAIKLERNYTKEEIIAMYFNTVDFGNNSFGIKTAANTYFGKAPADLNLDEAAVLVGMLKAISYYSPTRNPENATLRRNVVLNQMRKADFITSEVYEETSKKPLDMSHFTQQDHQYGLATYFREYLRLWMLKWCENHEKADGTKYDLYKDGLKIYTTINSRMQRYAEEAVNEYVGKVLQPAFYENLKGRENAPFIDISKEDIQRFMEQAMLNSNRYKSMKEAGASKSEINAAFKKPIAMKVFTWEGEKDTVMSPWDSLWYHKWFLHTGLMSIEPQTGYVRAYVGDINYKYFQFDNVMQGKRQVGSTFKPFVYTLAMQEGEFSPCTEVPNVPTCIEQEGQADWCPQNSNKAREGEMVTLRWALANSVNYISAYLIKRFPPQAVVNLAKKMGISSELKAVPAICLGVADISIKEMTAAMSTYANKGIYIEPIFVTRIEDRHGIILDQFTPMQNEAMSEETAYLMLELMKGVVDGGTAGRLRYKYGLTQTIAGKTGTTQNNSDGWFMGLTPHLVSGVWVGGELRSIHFRSTALGQGANTALPIWALYMKKVFADPKTGIVNSNFEAPSTPLSVDLNCKSSQNTTNPESPFEDEM
ncbi:MAG: transglycosylase domain-containing protein [Bacteroidales bacterium]